MTSAKPLHGPRAAFKFPWRSAILAGLALASTAAPALAQQVSIDLGQGEGFSRQALELVALITILSLAPSILIMTTGFVRIVVVLSLLRSAIGLQQSPPNGVIISLALFLTFFVMAPTFQQSWEKGVSPYLREELTFEAAIPPAITPLKTFMLGQTREQDLELFINIAKIKTPQAPLATPFHVLAPAFMISELKRAFEIGFLIFLPFLIIDLVTASLLLSMGMITLPPIVVSLPFKLVFFVLVDGWRLIAGSLVESFATGPPPV